MNVIRSRPSHRLDHLVVIAPSLAVGIDHVSQCIGIEVPFGQAHSYMGTHNHLLQLGDSVYLEIVSIDPDGHPPPYARWFGLDQRTKVQADWDVGRRLRGWVASTDDIDRVLARHGDILGEKVSLPWPASSFEIALRADRSLPMDGAAPTIIDRRGKPRSMTSMADFGARLKSVSLTHPHPGAVSELYGWLSIDRPPFVSHGAEVRLEALIDTRQGMKLLS